MKATVISRTGQPFGHLPNEMPARCFFFRVKDISLFLASWWANQKNWTPSAEKVGQPAARGLLVPAAKKHSRSIALTGRRRQPTPQPQGSTVNVPCGSTYLRTSRAGVSALTLKSVPSCCCCCRRCCCCSVGRHLGEIRSLAALKRFHLASRATRNTHTKKEESYCFVTEHTVQRGRPTGRKHLTLTTLIILHTFTTL